MGCVSGRAGADDFLLWIWLRLRGNYLVAVSCVRLKEIRLDLELGVMDDQLVWNMVGMWWHKRKTTRADGAGSIWKRPHLPPPYPTPGSLNQSFPPIAFQCLPEISSPGTPVSEFQQILFRKPCAAWINRNRTLSAPNLMQKLKYGYI